LWLACCAAYALETVVDGVPSSELYTAVLSRGSAEVLAGERSSLSPRSLQSVSSCLPSTPHQPWLPTCRHLERVMSSSSSAWAQGCDTQWRRRYNWCTECLTRRHHSEPAQLLRAAWTMWPSDTTITYFPGMTCCEWWLAIVFRPTEVPRLVNNVDITPRAPSLVLWEIVQG
jgi:hypothetical protein